MRVWKQPLDRLRSLALVNLVGLWVESRDTVYYTLHCGEFDPHPTPPPHPTPCDDMTKRRGVRKCQKSRSGFQSLGKTSSQRKWDSWDNLKPWSYREAEDLVCISCISHTEFLCIFATFLRKAARPCVRYVLDWIQTPQWVTGVRFGDVVWSSRASGLCRCLGWEHCRDISAKAALVPWAPREGKKALRLRFKTFSRHGMTR